MIFVKRICHFMFKKIIKVLIRVSPEIGSMLLYWRATGKKLNLSDPRDFNEKLQWLKFNWQHPLIVTCTDRVELRHYVEKKGLSAILIKSHGVFNNVSEIEWDKLPQQFVMKVNNGCGNHIVCSDKSSLDKVMAAKIINESMRLNYSLSFAEMHYQKIEPKIICEEYLFPDEGDSLDDYKIYCFNGVPKLILLCLERQNGKNLKRFFLDVEWKKMDIGGSSMNHGDIPIPVPKCIKQLLNYAEQLSQDFPFVRVDFYIHDKKPKLGEMTFTPMGCMAGNDYYSDRGLKILGEMLKLPKTTYLGF